MRDFFAVAKFTAKEMVKRKSFIISNILILAMIVIGFNIPNLIHKFKGSDELNVDKILIADLDNFYGESLKSINDLGLQTKFEIKNEKLELEKAKEMVNNDEYSGIILINNNNGTPEYKYVVNTLSSAGEVEQINNILDSAYKNKKLINIGLSEQQLVDVNNPIQIQVVELNPDNTAMMLITMMCSIVLFYAIYFCAYQVSNSITTEKTSKIMETLVTSCKPKTIVLGKTTGIGIIGIIQVLAIVITAVISYKLFLPKDILQGILDISKVTPIFIFVVFVYFILGYILFAMLYALTGSTVSKPEDVQSANGPIGILAILGFYLAYFSMMNPDSNINRLASIVPISSPFSMPFRFISEGNIWGDFAISVGVLIVSIILVAKIAIKIYSSAILHYGTKLSLKDLLNFYKDK